MGAVQFDMLESKIAEEVATVAACDPQRVVKIIGWMGDFAVLLIVSSNEKRLRLSGEPTVRGLPVRLLELMRVNRTEEYWKM